MSAMGDSDRAAVWRTPMLAQLVRPEDHYGSGQRWQYERKLDGLRCLAVRNGDQVELWSRNQLSFTARFPRIVEGLAGLDTRDFTLDGELVVFEGGRTSFARLQHPDGRHQPIYCVFDLLHLLGHDTTSLPLADRQSLLAQAVAGAPDDVVSVVQALDGEPASLLRQGCQQGWEGLVAKRVGSTYSSGRSADWQKLKCSASQELIVGGWSDPTGGRIGFGALLVGHYDPEDRLRYAGKVGTGFSDSQLHDLHQALLARSVTDSPFFDTPRLRGVHWVRPELIAAVSFTEWTPDGKLRHPSFLGLRTDKDPRTVRRETPG